MKKISDNVWDRLAHTKLLLPFLELQILEFCTIEHMAELWLKKAGINYSSLQNRKAWTIFIAAYCAMLYADEADAIQTDRKLERVPLRYYWFIKGGMLPHAFNKILKDIHEFEKSEVTAKFKELLKAKRAFSDFEADVMALSEFVASSVVESNDGLVLDAVRDSMYQFFLRAKDDYFQGEE